MARPKGTPNKRKKVKAPGVTFGSLIRSLRIREGMSQTSFAKKLDLHPSYISRLEAGMRRPSPEVLKHMSVLLKCPHERLIQVSGMVEENLLDEIRRGPVGSLSGEIMHLRSRLKPKKDADILTWYTPHLLVIAPKNKPSKRYRKMRPCTRHLYDPLNHSLCVSSPMGPQ